MTKEQKHMRNELVGYNNSLREAKAKLNRLYKQVGADPEEVRKLEEEVNRLDGMVTELCMKAYDSVIPDQPIETDVISSISELSSSVYKINNL